MPLPRAVARFNRRYTNRFIEPLVARTSGFIVVYHVGRRTGRAYRTPVNVFALGDHYLVALTYGPAADWAQNVLAGPATFVRRNVESQIVSAEVVGRCEAWPALPWYVRAALRVLRVQHFMRLRVASPEP